MRAIEQWAARLFDKHNRLLGEELCPGEDAARLAVERMARRQPAEAECRPFVAPTGAFYR